MFLLDLSCIFISWSCVVSFHIVWNIWTLISSIFSRALSLSLSSGIPIIQTLVKCTKQTMLCPHFFSFIFLYSVPWQLFPWKRVCFPGGVEALRVMFHGLYCPEVCALFLRTWAWRKSLYVYIRSIYYPCSHLQLCQKQPKVALLLYSSQTSW